VSWAVRVFGPPTCVREGELPVTSPPKPPSRLGCKKLTRIVDASPVSDVDGEMVVSHGAAIRRCISERSFGDVVVRKSGCNGPFRAVGCFLKSSNVGRWQESFE
jgi:hypothetical protein